MKSTQEHLTQIGAYLSGQTSLVERDELDRWVNASSENKQLFQEVKKVWENSGIKLTMPVDETETDWLMLKERLDKRDKTPKVISLFTYPTILKIAAGILLLAVSTYFLTRVPVTTQANPLLLQAGNEAASFFLPDSTRVWLNAHSSLKYEENYTAHRDVTLKGEGYFDVIHNEKSPFTVTTDYTYTRVLGTSFGIREDSLQTVLTVVEGTVSFSSRKDPTKNTIVKAKEKATCKAAGILQKDSVDNNKFSQWIKKDNPVVEHEKLRPLSYLKTTYTWKKNAINQSVVEGVVKSTSTTMVYQNITLQVSYTKANGKLKTIYINVPGTLTSGGEIRYRKKLHDILSSTREVTVKIESAETRPAP